MNKHYSTTLRYFNRRSSRRYAISALLIFLLASIGGYWLVQVSKADTAAVAVEAETGALRGNDDFTSNASASGGRTVQFGKTPEAVACVKDPSLYQPATPVAVSTGLPGLTTYIDPANYYDVNGYTAQQIRQQLTACSPIIQKEGEFDAITTWSIKFAYNTYSKTNGMCGVKDVAISAHINFLFPRWTSTGGAAEGLAARWQTYMTNLTTHENGHKDIAIQRSQQLLTDLQKYPDTSCSKIIASANAFGTNAINAIATASDTYDTQTQHGATQGAHFP